jgi:predicted small lipoprotein YifL
MKTLAVAVLMSLVVLGGCGPGGPLDFLSPSSAPPVVDSFDASPLTISAGETSTLSWKVSGATAVSIDNGIGTVALSGSRVVSPTTTTVYTLVASNSGGKSVSATAQVSVSGTGPSPTGVPLVTSFCRESARDLGGRFGNSGLEHVRRDFGEHRT